jgi:hypothetical protein
MSRVGHVWTAPWQELSDVLQHWSGAVTCPACWCGKVAAGPNALRGSGPKQNRALWKRCVDPSGFSRSTERPYLHYVIMPSPIGLADLAAGLRHAASSFGSLYLSSRTMMAQAILAILLASATAATFVGRRSINWPSHGRFSVPCFRE